MISKKMVLENLLEFVEEFKFLVLENSYYIPFLKKSEDVLDFFIKKF